LRGFAPQRGQRALPFGIPVGGAAPDTPFVGLCPTPQQGLCPCAPQGPLALDPSPGNPEGFPGCSCFGVVLDIWISFVGLPGGFPIAPWTPSVCILVSRLYRNNENRFSNKQVNIPSSGGAPKVSKGRSESPLVAREGETLALQGIALVRRSFSSLRKNQRGPEGVSQFIPPGDTPSGLPPFPRSCEGY